MPNKATQLLDMLGVDASKRTYEDATFGSDFSYGEAKLPVGKCAWDGLFPPLAIET
jgi:methionyl-tRNA synthetase